MSDDGKSVDTWKPRADTVQISGTAFRTYSAVAAAVLAAAGASLFSAFDRLNAVELLSARQAEQIEFLLLYGPGRGDRFTAADGAETNLRIDNVDERLRRHVEEFREHVGWGVEAHRTNERRFTEIERHLNMNGSR